jgi:hypothetical protein
MRALIPPPRSSAIRATGYDLSHRQRSAPLASIRAMGCNPRKRNKEIVAMTTSSGEKWLKLKE